MNDEYEKRKDTEPDGVPLERPRGRTRGAGLLSEVDGTSDDQFIAHVERTLNETQSELLRIEDAPSLVRVQSWEKARVIVNDFRPVPWFIWRLSNFVLGRPGQVKEIPEGLVFGLRRLLFAAASDSVLGTGSKISDARKALQILPADIVAAAAVIHAVCRRLASREFERIWRPILDDALLRARIGYMTGMLDPAFGSGRGMLAGFSGRCGLCILIAAGDLDQARKSLEMLASGSEIGEVGLRIYGCEPLQVSAMVLSASGCGRDAALGIAAFSTRAAGSAQQSSEEKKWLAALSLCEALRQFKGEEVPDWQWGILGFTDEKRRAKMINEARKAVRRGHQWNWLVS